MYYLGNIEIFDPARYGYDETNSPGIKYHWMVAWCSIIDEDTVAISSNEWVNKIISSSYAAAAFHKLNLLNSTFTRILPDETRSNYITHIANAETVYRHSSYLAPQLIEIDILPGGECIGIPRGSFWLKIFQRKWRNILIKRKEKINHYRQLNNMMNREMGIYTRISVV